MNHCRECQPVSQTISSPLESSNSSLLSSWSQTNNTCYGTLLVDQCKKAEGECVTVQEGFYTMSSVWLAIGAILFRYKPSTTKNGGSEGKRRIC